MIPANPFGNDRRKYDYSEVIDSEEFDWFIFYKVQQEDTSEIEEINEEMDGESDDEITEACRDAEAIILSLHRDTEVTEEALKKAEEW